jgi:hypothetical protein
MATKKSPKRRKSTPTPRNAAPVPAAPKAAGTRNADKVASLCSNEQRGRIVEFLKNNGLQKPHNLSEHLGIPIGVVASELIALIGENRVKPVPSDLYEAL